MSEETKIDITDSISFDLIKELIKKSKYTKYKDIKIYGTVNDPLFLTKDVENILGIKEIKMSRFKAKHKTTINIETSKGIRSHSALTERGLYKVILSTRPKIEDDTIYDTFHDFVFIVLNELRTKRFVTLDNALKKLQLEIKEKDILIDQEHEKALRYEKSAITEHNRKTALIYERENLRNEMKNKDVVSLELRIEELQKRYMHKLFLNVCKPPSDRKDIVYFDDDEKGNDDNKIENIDPNEEDQYVFTIATKPINIAAPTEIYVHSWKKEDKENLHKFLINRGLGVKKGEKTTVKNLNTEYDDIGIDNIYISDYGKYHINKYYSTINNIKSCISDYNSKIENEDPLF
jgi:prophage antirepressor-like protein